MRLADAYRVKARPGSAAMIGLMTTLTRVARRRGWVAAFLTAALASVLAVGVGLAGAGSASAVTTSTAQNRVGASHSTATVLVGSSLGITAGQQIGNSPVRHQIAVAPGVAANTGDDLVNLVSPTRTSHILDGEVRPNGTFGGGHRAGTGFPKKSEFPATWSDGQVMHNISDVATDPSLVWRPGAKPGDSWVNGTRDGLDIEVLIRNDEIWTAYPTNVARNP